jgi:hypothetical protein
LHATQFTRIRPIHERQRAGAGGPVAPSG